MPLTYDQIGDVYPPRGDQRWGTIARLVREAAERTVHVLSADDSQGTIGNAFGGGPAALTLALNQASGTTIPGTAWMPIRSRAGTGGFLPISHSSRAVSNIGTIDLTKYPPGFAPYAIDVTSTDSGFGLVILPDSKRVEHNLDMICQGQTALATKDDTSWYAEAIFCGCDNANIHGGSAQAEAKIDAYRGNNEAMYYGSGAAASFSWTSSGLGLTTIGVDVPTLFSAGPIPFSSNDYISATFRAGGAGKVRLAAARIVKRNAPGWLVTVLAEGGYRVLDASSWYASHANSGPFVRKMFSGQVNGLPDLVLCGLGTNDLFSGKTAAQHKAEVRTWCQWLWTLLGGIVPIVFKGEYFRGDTSTANYATYLAEYNQQAGAIKELIDEGFGPLFLYNGLRNATRYFGSQAESLLSGKTHLGNFTALVQAAGSVAITQNTHYVSLRERGTYQHWLYTGATTTIGTLGVINSERYGPGGDLSIGAPVNQGAIDVWQPLMPQFGRQGNVGPGAPNDFVHNCARGQQRDTQLFGMSLVGAAASAKPSASRLIRA